MKENFFLLLFLMLMSFTGCINRTKNVDSIVDQMISSRGMDNTLKSIKKQIQIWNVIDGQGNRFKCYYYFERPNKLRTEMYTLDGKNLLTTVYNNGLGYHNIMGYRMDMGPEEIAEYNLKCQKWVDGYAHSRSEGETFTLIDTKEIGKNKYYLLKFIDKNKSERTIYVNMDNGLEEIIEEYQYDITLRKKVPYKIILTSYKEFGGIYIPGKMEIYDKNNKVQIFELESVKNNAFIENEKFSTK